MSAKGLFPTQLKTMLTHRKRFSHTSHRRRSSIREDILLLADEYISEMKEKRPRSSLKSDDVAILWERKFSGYRIVDLRLDRFMQASRFILTHFCQTEPLAKAVNLQEDAVSIRNYMNMIVMDMTHDYLMNFCALQEGTEELVGVLIASILKKHQQQFPLKGNGLHEITMLKNYVIAKALSYQTVDAEKSICVDILCVKSDHQRKGVGTALLRSCIVRGVAVAPAFVGVFTSDASQTIAERLGFKKLSEIPYRILGAEDTKYQVFESCYPENYSIACMALEITLPEEQQLPTSVFSVKEKLVKKRSTAKKKKRKLKK